MKKKDWRRALAYLYDEHVGPSLFRWRGRHRFEDADEYYMLHRLAAAVDVMRFADRHMDAVETGRLRKEISTIAGAGKHVADLDQRSGLARVLAEHRELIASELTISDVPPHDLQFLSEAGIRDPEMELRLAIGRIQQRTGFAFSADERGLHRGAVGMASNEARRIEEEIGAGEPESSGPRKPPDRPPRRPFKGLGGIGKGFGLVIADTLAVVDWPVATPDVAKAGAMASFALGWDGIMCGLGDLRGE